MILPTDFPDRQLASFASCLRKRGVQVSVAEVTDAIRAVAGMETMDLNEFRETLRLCLVKKVEDSPVFDREFDRFFLKEEVISAAALQKWRENLPSDDSPSDDSSSNNSSSNNSSSNNSSSDNLSSDNLSSDDTSPDDSSSNDSSSDDTSSDDSPPDDTSDTDTGISAVSGGKDRRRKQEEELWRSALGQKEGLPESFRSFLSGDELGAVRAARQEQGQVWGSRILETVWQAVESGTIVGEEYDSVLRTLEKYMKLVASLKEFRGAGQVSFGKEDVGQKSVGGTPPLNLPMDSLSEHQARELQRHIRDASQNLYTRLIRLNGSHSRRLSFDYRQTIRKSLAAFGEPFWPVYRARKRKLRQLVTICDVSGSVKYATRILLCFMYEIHQAFEGRARHFIFVGRLDEVTSFFSENSFDDCFAKAMRGAGVDYRGYSDYGLAFRTFVQHFIDAVDSDTVVLVLGDARSNRRDPGTSHLMDICRRAHSLVWLNPEMKRKWDTNDSVMSHYRKCVGEVVEISEFGQLLEFVDRLPAIVGIM